MKLKKLEEIKSTVFKKKLEFIFGSVIIIAVLVLVANYYKSYSFEKNEIPQSYKKRIAEKEKEILYLMQKNYGRTYKFPIIVTDRFKGRYYGITTYDRGDIKIYLNKKVMRESMDYMVDSVIAHEYAHALMFKLGHIDKKTGGHSPLWRDSCNKLGGKNCGRYVDREDVISGKLPFSF
jgi:hypothetical protein